MGDPPQTDHHAHFFACAFCVLAAFSFFMMFTAESVNKMFMWLTVSFVCDGAVMAAIYLDTCNDPPAKTPRKTKSEKSEDLSIRKRGNMITLPTLTYEKAEMLLLEIANERPDYVYERHPGAAASCRYVWDGQCDCIIGHFFNRFGVPIEEMQRLEGKSARAVYDICKDRYFTVPLLDVSRTKRLLNLAQLYQDQGKPWMTAVQDAIIDAGKPGLS